MGSGGSKEDQEEEKQRYHQQQLPVGAQPPPMPAPMAMPPPGSLPYGARPPPAAPDVKMGAPSGNTAMVNGGGPLQPSCVVPAGPPPARPPSTRKDDVFRVEDYHHVDQHVLKTPKKCNHGNFRQLNAYLTSDSSWDDLAKVRAIFRWVTSMDVFNLPTENLPPKQSPLDYFYRIKNGIGNHAQLFNTLCKMANIPCEIIGGMNKSAAYEMGKPVDRKAMGGQWNAVYVAGDWRHVDAFWASTCVVGRKSGEWALMDAEGGAGDDGEEAAEGTSQHRINEFYFLTNPEELIWTHFPDNTKWQLLGEPILSHDFQDHFYVRERFHILGMAETPHSHRACVLNTTDGELSLEFSLPPASSANYRYKHMLYRSRTKSDAPPIDSFLDRFVFFEHLEDVLRFALRFPVQGTFKLDIYGLDINDSDIFDLCCSYIIECPQAKANCLPFPDCPPLGWGPGQKAKEAGLKPVTNKSARVVAENGYAEVRLDKEKALALHQQLRHAVLDDATLSKYCLTRLEDGEVIIYLRLPQKGEYALKLFAQDVGAEGEADNVLNYLVQCQGQTEENQPFPNTSHGILGKGPDAARFGIEPLTHHGGTLDTTDGKVSVKFAANPRAELLCEVHTVDKMAARHVTVTRGKEEGDWVFDLDLPVKGVYSLSVFAKDEDKVTEIFNVHTYLVQSDGHGLDSQTNGEENNRADGNQNDIRNETVATSDKEAMMPVPPGCLRPLAEFHPRHGHNAADCRPVELLEMGDMKVLHLSLDDFGEYMLNVFTQPQPGSGLVRTVAKYQVNRRRPGELYSDNLAALMDTLKEEEQNEEPEEDLQDDINDSIEKVLSPGHTKQQDQCRKAVQQAMDLKDHKQLEAAIARYLDTEVDPEDPVLVRAQCLLAALHAKAELMEATQKGEVAALERALQRAREVNLEHQLDLQIAMAQRLKDHLIRLEKLRHSVLHMEQKTVAEIKSYASPPAGVHESMMATFLLLGSTLKSVKQWRTCITLMSKTGKESMMRKISQFSPQAVPMRAAFQAKRAIKAFTTDQIRGASAGSATFYIWAVGMIEEVESYGGAEKADQFRLQK